MTLEPWHLLCPLPEHTPPPGIQVVLFLQSLLSASLKDGVSWPLSKDHPYPSLSFSFLLSFSRSVMSDTLVTPWTVALRAPLSMEFSRQEYCSGLPYFPPVDLPNRGIEHTSPALAGGFITTESPLTLFLFVAFLTL